MSKDEGGRNSSFSEKPVRSRPRRLVEWINPTGAKKAHSSVGPVALRPAQARLPGRVDAFLGVSEA